MNIPVSLSLANRNQKMTKVATQRALKSRKKTRK
jgi:hypothetical protein